MFRNKNIVGLAVVFLLCAGASAAIWLSSIEGTCVDERGQPIAGATLRFEDHSTGRRFQTTTNDQGKFYYIAVESGNYELELQRPGGPAVTFPHVQIVWSAQTLTVSVDLRNNTVEVTRHSLQPEAYRSQDTPAALEDEDPMAAEINRKLAAAKAHSDRGDWLAALDPLTSAVKLDPRHDVPRALLANAYCKAAKQSPRDATALLQQCVAGYQAAIRIADRAAYENNLGTAYAEQGLGNEAIQRFRAAETLSPANRGMYEMNIGLMLVQGTEHLPQEEAALMLSQAGEAFDAALGAEPQNAEAYYWKGIVLLRLAAAGSAKASYRDAAAAFQKYLALAPKGLHAAEINGLLPSMQQMAEPSR